jgi:hypothetical protein
VDTVLLGPSVLAEISSLFGWGVLEALLIEIVWVSRSIEVQVGSFSVGLELNLTQGSKRFLVTSWFGSLFFV